MCGGEKNLTTIYPVHCHKCPIELHCPYGEVHVAQKFGNSDSYSSIPEEIREAVSNDDTRRMIKMSESCPLLRTVASFCKPGLH